MWDWYGWQRAKDYGEHYDYGLFVLTPKGVHIFNTENSRCPRKGWLAYLGKPVSPDSLPSRVVAWMEVVDTKEWCQFAQGTLGGAGLTGRLTLTRGCAAAAWGISKRPDSVVLVGCDNVRLGTNQAIEASFCPEYWDTYMRRFSPNVEKVYPIGVPQTATHDMRVELPLLEHLAKKFDVKLEFAEEVWK